MGGMGHGCTNYGGFGEKELGGIGWVWGLDRKRGVRVTASILRRNNRTGSEHVLRMNGSRGSVRLGGDR